VNHIVAIADESDLQPFQLSFMLQQGETVGQHLTRMKEIRERVDHRDCRVKSHLLQGLLSKGPDDDEIHPAAETARAIRRALPNSQLDFPGTEKHCVAPELDHAGLKTNQCSQARLLKYQSECLPGQQSMGDSPLLLAFQLSSKGEDLINLFPAEIA
jgi:hypothetical protein